MKFGLTDEQISNIIACFVATPEVDRVVIFGSRALGNHKPTSDVDLYVEGALVDALALARLSGKLDEDSRTPFTFDVVGSTENLDSSLLDHIRQFGKVLYIK